MTYLNAIRLEHSYGAQRVLEDVSFSISAGERLCLLGPSGCGKTTTLHVLAGFVRPDKGVVELKGSRIENLPPERRNIGIMFQNYALFPHMTIFDNVAFGLRMRGMEKNEQRTRVEEALSLVRLSHAASKKPSQLSGGEQQRIAFARAVVIRPSLLLLDEPFSNLDARLRLEMRTELLELLRKLYVATVMVTHDQEEAMAIADRIAVMSRGRIEQVGSPTEIYNNPSTLFVGRFVGESNVFPATIVERSETGDTISVAGLGQFKVRHNPSAKIQGDARLMVRPEHLEIGDALAGWNSFEGEVERRLFLGHRTEWIVRSGRERVTVWQTRATELLPSVGEAVTVRWLPENSYLVSGGGLNA